MELNGIKQLSQALENKDISVKELYEIYLKRHNTHAK
jgi:hypothetical protein